MRKSQNSSIPQKSRVNWIKPVQAQIKNFKYNEYSKNMPKKDQVKCESDHGSLRAG